MHATPANGRAHWLPPMSLYESPRGPVCVLSGFGGRYPNVLKQRVRIPYAAADVGKTNPQCQGAKFITAGNSGRATSPLTARRTESSMSITWGNRIVVDPTFQGLHGIEAAGAYALRFSISFQVSNWPLEETPPQVTLTSAPVKVEMAGRSLLMGYAIPEAAVPFNVGQYGYSTGLIYEFIATPYCMEAIERLRDGTGVTFRLKVCASLRSGDKAQGAQEEIPCRVSQSDWLSVLATSAYREVLLLEIPMASFADDQQESAAARYLANAQSHLLQGHYAEAVASCRLALEAWTSQRNEIGAMTAAREQQRTAPKSLSLQQRELLVRQSVSNLSNLAHHADDFAVSERFDRESAKLMIGLTGSILGRLS